MKCVPAAMLSFSVLSGCADAISDGSESILYGAYESYIYALESKAPSTALQHLAQRHAIKLHADQQWSDFEHALPVISVLDHILPTVGSSFESVQHNTGCLTVNGKDPDNEPTSINIEFVQEDSTWKMDYVQVVYHEAIEDFPKTAICPTRLP